MKQLTVFVKDNSYNHFIELIKHLSYVEKIEIVEEIQTKQDIKNNISTGLSEVKKFKKSELEVTSSKQFMNELQHLSH